MTIRALCVEILWVKRVLFLAASLCCLSCAFVQAAPNRQKLGLSLLDAAGQGDLTRVRSLIARGAPVDFRDESGETPLQKAAFGNAASGDTIGHTRVVRFLLQRGAQVNSADKQGETALLGAVLVNPASARVLLDAGANVNARSKRGDTPFLYAAGDDGPKDGDNHAMMQLLVARGADVRARNEDGENALFQALQSKQLGNARFVLDKGVPINQADKDGETPLMQAARAGSNFVPLLLKRGANTSARDKDGKTALFYADERATPVLLQAKADPNARDKTGDTPLMQSDSEKLALLLQGGAQVNARNKWNETALMRRISDPNTGEPDETSVRRLLDARADANAQDASGRTALMRAVYRDESEAEFIPNPDEPEGKRTSFSPIIRLLLQRGAKTELRDNIGKTALLIASRWGNIGVVRLLLARRANPNVADRNGDSAFQWARANGHRAIETLLQRAGARPFVVTRNPLRRTQKQQWALDQALASAHHLSALKAALDQGASPDARFERGPEYTANGEPALVSAASEWPEGQPDLVRVLLSVGANPNLRDFQGNTALIVSASAQITKMLLDAGADPNARNRKGFTALMSACGRGSEDGTSYADTKQIALLLKNGARADLRDKSGKSALDYLRESEPNPAASRLIRRALAPTRKPG